MNLNFIWEALTVLFVGYVLLRIAGKKTVSQMTGLEVITLLATASMIGHAVAGDGLWKTLLTLCTFVALLIAVQFLALKFDWIDKWFIGKATMVVQDGKIIAGNLRKLRMSVDQLEAQLRAKGISDYSDLKTATIELSGQIGYEWKRHAKPVTIGDLEAFFHSKFPPLPEQPKENLFQEVVHGKHQKEVPTKWD
jgi:Predicted membrane protein